MTVVSERRVISKDVEPLPGDGYYAPIEHFFYDSTPAVGDVHPLLERYRLGGTGAEQQQLLTVEGFFLRRRSLDVIRAERKRLGVERRGIQFYRFKPTHELVGLMSHRGIKPYILLNEVGETGGVGDAWPIFWAGHAGERIDFPQGFELPDDCRGSLALQDTNDPTQKMLVLQKPAHSVSANG